MGYKYETKRQGDVTMSSQCLTFYFEIQDIRPRKFEKVGNASHSANVAWIVEDKKDSVKSQSLKHIWNCLSDDNFLWEVIVLLLKGQNAATPEFCQDTKHFLPSTWKTKKSFNSFPLQGKGTFYFWKLGSHTLLDNRPNLRLLKALMNSFEHFPIHIEIKKIFLDFSL